jgi:hypothetical protein
LTNRAYKERESSEDWAVLSRAPEGASGNGATFLVGAWPEPPANTTEDPDPFSRDMFGWSVARHLHSTGGKLPPREVPLLNPLGSEFSVLTDLERQMAQFSAEEEEDFKRLRREYVLVNGPSVESFLRRHRSLLEVLLDAVAQIKACFGAESVLQLRLGSEDGDAPNVVCGFVQWTKSLEAARAALDEFDESWWMNNVRRASGRVVFDYELA